MPNILECLPVFLGIFDQDINYQFVLIMFRSKVCSLVKVATLSTHGDGGVEVEFQIAWRFDKLFKFIYVFELCITIKEEGSVVSCCFVMLVQLFKILNQVMYSLGIEELNKLIDILK